MADIYAKQNPGWAVIVTKVACEHLAEKTIKAGGYRVFAPVYKKFVRPTDGRGVKASKGEIVSRPLFPGYIFVELWPGQEFGVEQFVGAVRVLHYPSKDGKPGLPRLVPGVLIERIRKACDAGEFDKLPLSRRISPNGAKPGDLVRVETGPFASCIGRLRAVDDDKMRAVILLSILGRETPVTISDAELEIVEEAAA